MPNLKKVSELAQAFNNVIAANYPDGIDAEDGLQEIVMAAGTIASTHIAMVASEERRNLLLRICVQTMRKTGAATTRIRNSLQ